MAGMGARAFIALLLPMVLVTTVTTHLLNLALLSNQNDIIF